MSSTPAPVVHGHELSAQDLDLLGYPCGPPTPWNSSPPPSSSRGSLPMAASPLPTQCTLLPPSPQPQVKVTPTSTPATVRLCMPILMVPPAFCWGPARHLPHHTHFSFGRGGARVAQVYPRPQDSAPQGMAPTSCHYGTPAPIATQPVSTPASLAPGLVTGSLVLRTYAMMESRAGKPFCTSS